jgi:predicted permease
VTNWQSGWRKLTRVWRANAARDVDEEIQFHFDNKVSEFVAQGMSLEDANARARTEFGDVDAVRSALHAIDARIVKRNRRAEWWELVVQDTRYVVRSLARAPLFTSMVIVTLALGLGANAALFSLIDRMYMQMPPGVRDVSQVQRVYERSSQPGGAFTVSAFSFAQLQTLSELAPPGMEIAGYGVRGLRPGTARSLKALSANYVLGNYFGVLGVTPAIGRFFAPEETQIQGLSLLAVISDELWTREFQRDPNIIGRTIDIGAHHHQIIGVAPAGFHGLDVDNVDVWVPQNTSGILRGRSPNWYEENYRRRNVRIFARVQSAAIASLFNSRATAVMRSDKAHVDSMSTTFLGSLIASRADGSQSAQLTTSTRLAGVSIVILLIACANVVNLMLARAASREREVAVRVALGVTRGRLIAQLLTEGALLSMGASLAALVIAWFVATFLQHWLFPYVRFASSVIDARTVTYTIVVALATGIGAGLIPALQFSKPNLSHSLKSTARDGGRAMSPVRSSMLIAQVALTLVLLAGAGVFVRSMQSVESIQLGMDTDRLQFAQVDFNIEEGDHEAEFAARLPAAAERLRHLPGIESVALSDGIPFFRGDDGKLFLPGRDSLPAAGSVGRLRYVVSPEYFKTVGIRVLKGRGIVDADRKGAEPIIVINETFAQNVWPGSDLLTKCVIVSARTNPCRRVVGVVSATHYGGVMDDPAPQYYLPLEQMQGEVAPAAIAIRTAPDRSAAVALAVSRELSAEYGPIAMPMIEPLNHVIQDDLRIWRVGAALFGAAGVLALLVAAVGIYSSMAYMVSQRTHEMGIRVALGASANNIVQLVVTQGTRLVLVGVLVGVGGALALGQLIASMLYKTSPRDPAALATSVATLLLVAVIACALPAWRASRVDPLSAMRAE